MISATELPASKPTKQQQTLKQETNEKKKHQSMNCDLMHLG